MLPLIGGIVFSAQPILIVEDEPLIAMDLAGAVEDLEGVVIGPFSSVAAALELLETLSIAAAILDANLLDRDITPVALRLACAGVPLVVYTGTGLPPELAEQHPSLPVLLKPATAQRVVERLVLEMQKPTIAPA